MPLIQSFLCIYNLDFTAKVFREIPVLRDPVCRVLDGDVAHLSEAALQKRIFSTFISPFLRQQNLLGPR